MKYDFDTIIDRRNTQSVKWDCSENELPMWIADMDFKTSPAIIDALKKRTEHGIFGYTYPHDDWYEAYINYYKDRHSFNIEKDWLIFSLGVVPTISSTVRKITNIGDNVVVLSPVYNIFYNSIINNQRKVLEVPLIYKNFQYSIDFEKLEEVFKNPKTTLIIFCNPANPISKIWSKEELEEVGRLAYKYHVVVLSDEIHGELTRPSISYLPFASINEINKMNSITCVSPTKSFNLAGIHTSAIIIPNDDLRKKVDRQINTDEVAEPNVFSCIAAVAALNDSRDWLDQLREYIFSNRDYALEFINKNIKDIKMIEGDATYLLWLDVSKVTNDSKELADYLLNATGLHLASGDIYGTGGKTFLRMNIACPRSVLDDGLNRLKEGIKKFKR